MKNQLLRKALIISILLFVPGLSVISVYSQNMFRKINDFDGDGKADYAVTRNENGVKIWYIWQSANGFTAYQWGFDTDQNVAGDYDGDGKTDIAIYRQVEISPRCSFWINGSLTGVQASMSHCNDNPNSIGMQQDYDGDGKTDVAYTTQNHTRIFIAHSTGGTIPLTSPGGNLIRIGDFDGDSKADLSGYDSNSNVVTIKHSSTSTPQTIQFGISGDQFLAADFDGDGKGELAVFRESDGSWWWLRSSDNIVHAATWGQPGDKPVPVIGSQTVALRKTNIRLDRNRKQWEAVSAHYAIPRVDRVAASTS